MERESLSDGEIERNRGEKRKRKIERKIERER